MVENGGYPESSGGSQFFLWTICAIAAFGGFLFGYDVIVMSGTVPQVAAQFRLSAVELGLLVSVVLWGCAIGSGLSGLLLDPLGRRWSLILSAVILFISALWSALAPDPIQLILSRFLGGLGCGLASATAPLYISEISPEGVRGRMVVLYHLSVCLGIVVCVFANWGIYASSRNATNSSLLWNWFSAAEYWRGMYIAEALPGFLFLVLSLFLPESPRWLIGNGRPTEARRILARINGPERSETISRAIEEATGGREQGRFRDLFATDIRKTLKLALLIGILSEACGISAVLYYGPQLLEQVGLTLGQSLGGFSIIAIVNLVFNLVAMAWLDRFGRRRLMGIGTTGAMLSLIALGTLYLTGRSGILIVAAVITFMAFFAFSVGPIKFVVISEVFPYRIRSKAISLVTVAIWITSAVVAQLFPILREMMPTGMVFYLFALDLAVLLAVVLFQMPETKGRSIEEITSSGRKADA